MPNDHPLLPFVRECLTQRGWDSRALCGAVRRRYEEWSRNIETQKLGHVQFSREMRKHWPRKGSQHRSYYVGIELRGEEDEDVDEDEDTRTGKEVEECTMHV
jgi:hypothetical protein